VNKDELRKHYEKLLENTETDMLRKVAIKIRKGKTEARTESAQKVLDPVSARDGQDDAKEESTGNSDREEKQGGSGNEVGRQETRATRTEMAIPTADICRRDLEYDVETKAEWTKYLTPKQRATMRIPKEGHPTAAKIPLISRFFKTKVDTIYYCRRMLARLNVEIEIEARAPEAFKQNLSAFV
jgi:hypothetical protein